MVGDRKLYEDTRTLQERLNAQRSDNPPALDSNPNWQGEFTDMEVIGYLEDDEELVTDGGYEVDCPYREQSDSGRDYCDRFGMDTDEEICGGCRVADQIIDEGVETSDLL